MWQAYLKLNFRVCTICLQFDYVFLLKSNFSYHLQTSNPKTRQTIRNPNQMPGLHQIHWGTSNPEPETQTECQDFIKYMDDGLQKIEANLGPATPEPHQGISKIGGTLLSGPSNEDPCILGCKLGSPLPSLQLC